MFAVTEQKALLELNVLLSFIKECSNLDPVPDNKTYVTTMDDFTKCFKAFCKKNSLRQKVMNYSFYSGPFSKCQLKVIVPDYLIEDPFGQKSPYILGLKLKESAFETLEKK